MIFLFYKIIILYILYKNTLIYKTILTKTIYKKQ